VQKAAFALKNPAGAAVPDIGEIGCGDRTHRSMTGVQALCKSTVGVALKVPGGKPAGYAQGVLQLFRAKLF
jgi:hypothetical protein